MMTIPEVKRAIRLAGFRARDWDIRIEAPLAPPRAGITRWNLCLSRTGCAFPSIRITAKTPVALLELLARQVEAQADAFTIAAVEWRRYSDAMTGRKKP